MNRTDAVSVHPIGSWAPEVIASAPDGVLLVDQRGAILLANKAMEQISGFSESELVGQLVEILMPAEHHARHREDVHSATGWRKPAGWMATIFA